MILKPRDNTFALPSADAPGDLFKVIAEFNGFEYLETNSDGVAVNTIAQNYFFVDRIDTVTPQLDGRLKYDGVLFVAIPVDTSVEVNEATFNPGQYNDIIKPLISKLFYSTLLNYIKCDYAIVINSIKPLYNSTKHTRATVASGIEIAFSIWI